MLCEQKPPGKLRCQIGIWRCDEQPHRRGDQWSPVGVGVLDDPSAIGRLPLARQRTVREAVPYDLFVVPCKCGRPLVAPTIENQLPLQIQICPQNLLFLWNKFRIWAQSDRIAGFIHKFAQCCGGIFCFSAFLRRNRKICPQFLTTLWMMWISNAPCPPQRGGWIFKMHRILKRRVR